MRAHLNTIIVSAAILLTAVILSNAFIQRNKATKNISVTGLGKKDFVADLIVWSGSFTQKNMSLKEAYANLDRDREHIQKYLLSKGLRSENIIFSAVEINKLFDDVYDIIFFFFLRTLHHFLIGMSGSLCNLRNL